MRVVAWLVVGVVSLVSGGFAIPIGFSLGLSTLEVYLSATVGAMIGLGVFLFAGEKVRTRLLGERGPAEPDEDSRIHQIAERFGARGLGLVGPIFPGVTASVLIGLALDIKRSALARWMSIGIAVMYAVYCVGLWVLIEAVGVS